MLSSAACKKDTVTAPKTKPVTQAEADTFARRLASALQPCDGRALQRFLDMDGLMRTAVAQSKAPSEAKKDVLAGMRESLDSFVGRLCSGANSTYHLLRVREDHGIRKALFRFLGDDGVNYLEFYIGKNDKDEVLAYDFYSFLSAERVSDTLSNLLDTGFGDVEVMRNPERLARAMAEVERHMAANRFEEARAALASLPKSLRTSHTIMLHDLQIAANLDEATYLAAIDAFEAKFPDDPSLDMVLLDGFYMRKAYAEAAASVERLSRRVGGDPYLDALRAGILSEQGKHAEARALVKRAWDAEPELENIHWVRARVAAREGRFDEVSAALGHLHTAFGVTFTRADIEADPVLAGFVESSEGKTFLDSI